MTDYTIIFTTVGASAVTGLGGYLTARIQSTATIRQAEAENERLRQQHSQAHFDNRQNTYHQLLNALSARHAMLQKLMWAAEEPEDEEALKREFENAKSGFQRDVSAVLNGVRLFGTAPVKEAADAVGDALGELDSVQLQALMDADEPTFAVRALISLAAGDEERDELNKAIHRLVDAMREDVAPDIKEKPVEQRRRWFGPRSGHDKT